MANPAPSPERAYGPLLPPLSGVIARRQDKDRQIRDLFLLLLEYQAYAAEVPDLYQELFNAFEDLYRTHDLMVELGTKEKDSLVTEGGVAGRQALDSYRRCVSRLVNHMRDISALCRTPPLPGRPDPRELAVVQVTTQLLPDMAELIVSVPWTVQDLDGVDACLNVAADREQAYKLTLPTDDGEGTRLDFLASFLRYTLPCSTTEVFKRSGENAVYQPSTTRSAPRG